MARLIPVVLALTGVLFCAALIHAAPEDSGLGKILFLEGGKDSYFRRNHAGSNLEGHALSSDDAVAAVAVLLGVPPRDTLSASSSSKLDELLSPNPFKRPRAVLALSVGGISSESVTDQEIEEIMGSSVQRRALSLNVAQQPFELPGKDVTLQSLNNGEYDSQRVEQGLEDLASFLKGSFHKDEETGTIVLEMPLPAADEFSISLDFTSKRDWKFAVDLVSLFQVTRVPSSRIVQGGPTPAKLFTARFNSLELMEEGSRYRHDATKLFLYTSAKVLGTMEARYNGQLVGVFTLLTSSTSAEDVAPMFSVSAPRIPRFLLDDALAPSANISANQSTYDADVHKLMSRSLVIVTVLILILSTLMGSFYLVFMPLTRDTLLYAAVKLD